ncbi:MAG: PEP-CTERM sorting domain-containing protein [Cyanobacteria bacterium P01_D01_bin.6]
MWKQTTVALMSTAAIGVGFAGSAEAGTFTYDFTGQGNPSDQDSLLFKSTEPSGPELTVMASEGGGMSPRPVRITNSGLAVNGTAGLIRQVDSTGASEALQLIFEDIRLRFVSATFSKVDDNDRVQLNLGTGSGAIFDGLIGDDDAVDFADLSAVDSTFFLTASKSSNGDSKWRLASATFATVPEPASLLGLAAIGAIAAGGALKKKASA